jgi:hypothetical protein
MGTVFKEKEVIISEAEKDKSAMRWNQDKVMFNQIEKEALQ